jgi:hypothetical protein
MRLADPAGAQEGLEMMQETFTLLALIYVGGDDFELIRRPGLTRRDCQMQAFRIESDRGAMAFCFDDPEGPVQRPGRPSPRLAPHICGYGGCWPTDGPGNSMLYIER